MASTVSLANVAGFVTYINTKAGNETGIEGIGTLIGVGGVDPNEVVAYANGDSKSVILPYHYSFNGITLPTKESDGATASNQTFKFYNAFRVQVSVIYSGNAKA